MDFAGRFIGFGFGLGNVRAQTHHAQHAAAVGQHFALFVGGGARVEHFADLVGRFNAADYIAFARRFGVVVRRQHHADRRFVFPFCLHGIEFPRQSSLHQIDQIAVQTAHNRLRFRVAEAAVEFDGERRAACINHQAGIQKAREFDAVGLHAAHGGQDDFVHRALINGGRYHGGGAVCAHAAGVRALVAVQQALVVLAGGHRQNVFAVHHHDEAGFFAG